MANRRNCLLFFGLGIAVVLVVLSVLQLVGRFNSPDINHTEHRSPPTGSRMETQLSVPGDEGRVASIQSTHLSPHSPPTDGVIRVIVLRDDSREPVARAQVAICDLDLLREAIVAQDPQPNQQAREKLFAAIARSATSDTGGQASLPLQGSRQLIQATHDEGLWGQAVLTHPPAGPVEILVSEHRTLFAVVLSAEGWGPVGGIPVVLSSDLGVSPTRMDLSGDDGIAMFKHVQSTVAPNETWHVGLGFPVCDQRQVPVRLDDLPSDPITLVLPPTGVLDLSIHDESGRPVSGGEVWAEITVSASAALGIALPCEGARRAIEFDDEGRATVQFLGLDLPLHITARPRNPHSSHAKVQADIHGPRRAGEVVTCSLLWASDTNVTAVTGRFVGRDGMPWPSGRVEAWAMLFPAGEDSLPPREVPVSENGRFRFVVREPCPPGGTRSYRLICIEPEESRGIEGRLDLSRPLPSGDTELGDILLDRGTLLAAGTVLDQAGTPLDNARLELLQLVRAGGREYWVTYDCAGGSTIDPEGSFFLWAIPGLELPRSNLRLRARCRGYCPAPDVDIALGQRDMRIVLQRGGSIAGFVRLAPGQDASEIAIVLLADGRSWTCKVGEDGSFAKDKLPPGVLRLVAYSRTECGTARTGSRISVDELRIENGAVNYDPRIQGLEVLPETDNKLTIRVVDATAKPIAGATIEHGEGCRVMTNEQGEATIRPERVPADLQVYSSGYRTLNLESVLEDCTVVLAEGLRIRLITDAAPIGSEPRYHLGFRVVPLDERGQRGSVIYRQDLPSSHMYFDEAGEATVPVPGPGSYLVEPMVYVDYDKVGRGARIPMNTLLRITVLDMREVQIFHIEIPQHAVKRTVQAIVDRD